MNCPKCNEPLLAGKRGEECYYLCPDCHREVVVIVKFADEAGIDDTELLNWMLFKTRFGEELAAAYYNKFHSRRLRSVRESQSDAPKTGNPRVMIRQFMESEKQ